MNISPELWALITTIVGVLVGALIAPLQNWITRKAELQKEMAIHALFVCAKDSERPIHFRDSIWGKSLDIPLRLEFINTSGINRIVRDVNIHAYFHGKEVGTAYQFVATVHRDESEDPFGDNGAYTFVIPEQSAKQYDLSFAITPDRIQGEDKCFDRLVLSFHDEKDEEHRFKLIDINECWVAQNVPTPKSWIKVSDFEM